jgi:hypothetical protein
VWNWGIKHNLMTNRFPHSGVKYPKLSEKPPSTGVSRAWRFAWDPIFWELCSTTARALRIDLQIYRDLSPAARRLYLLLKKLFWRSDQTTGLDIRDLGVHVLGFSPASPTKEIKRKLSSCVDELLDQNSCNWGLSSGTFGTALRSSRRGSSH